MSRKSRGAIALAVLWAAFLPLSHAGAHLLSAPASVPSDDPLYVLLKQQTETFTDASSRLDQTAMNKLLDDDVLFSSGSGSLDRTPARGQLVLRDFVVRRSGDVAVATFFHDRDTNYSGQVLHEIYRSSECWVRRGAEWKMISSQGSLLQKDPLVVNLSRDELNSYVGTYAAGAEINVRISRQGNALAASTNREKSVPLNAEASGIFFTPGSPRTTLIFQHDASGYIYGYINRRDERDLLFTATTSNASRGTGN